MFSIALVCLSVCNQHYLKTDQQIAMQFYGVGVGVVGVGVGGGSMKI